MERSSLDKLHDHEVVFIVLVHREQLYNVGVIKITQHLHFIDEVIHVRLGEVLFLVHLDRNVCSSLHVFCHAHGRLRTFSKSFSYLEKLTKLKGVLLILQRNIIFLLNLKVLLRSYLKGIFSVAVTKLVHYYLYL